MAVIYKISCKDLNVKECYYGSTKDFKERKNRHKINCYNENDKHYITPVYIFIRLNGGWDNFEMNVVEEIDSIDKEIIKKCERKYIEENIDIVLNKELPGRTKKEWDEYNKEKLSEYRKEWYQDNKEKISEKNKIYYEKNKETLNENIKEYRENNKEKIKQRKKDYYEKNKDEINRKRRERYQNKKNDSK